MHTRSVTRKGGKRIALKNICGKEREDLREEKVIFPLIENHLPQYGCTLLHFRAEHETLLNELFRLRRLLQLLT